MRTTATAFAKPSWLQPQLFEELLQSTLPGYKLMKDFQIQAAIAAQNYATILLRILLTVETQEQEAKQLSYFIKVAHQNSVLQTAIKEINFFETEAQVYANILPEFESMYAKAGLDIKFAPKFYALKTNESNILLEDLKGFKNANSLEGLDELHVKCVLKKLAQWHAASANYVALKGKFNDIVATGFNSENRLKIMQRMNESMGGVFLQCAQQYKGQETYLSAVQNLQQNLLAEIEKFARVNASEFNVLNHGDLWSNNLMFQYDAFGKIKQLYFVDFQTTKYGSPAQDLLYFLLSSVKFELKLSKFDGFVKFYHDQLIEHLQLLKYAKNMPKLCDIQQALYKGGVWAYLTATGILAAVLMEPQNSGNAETNMPLKQHLFSNEKYRQQMELILPWLHNRGAFSC